MLRAAQSLLIVSAGLIALSLLAATWQLGCADEYFYGGLGVGFPGLGCLLLTAIGWQPLETTPSS